MTTNEHLFKKPDNRLEELIQEKGYTLKQISSETNIPITTLSGYKKNLRTPKKENAEKLANYFDVSIPYLLGLDDNKHLLNVTNESLAKGIAETPTLKDSDSTKDNLELSCLTLFQKICFDEDSRLAFENIIYSIHLLSENDDEHSKRYINSVTNYLSKIIAFNISSLGKLTPFHRSEKAKFEYEFKKYILPFETAVLKLGQDEKEKRC
ncbi:helix-turn-helix domain-containing protein [Streptococcus iniae]|nr:helix-turn-helix transcriptional regulator [Streptococcus iniae]OHX26181.1 hypothetical protein BKX95_11790 [Streptococcus iniae]